MSIAAVESFGLTDIGKSRSRNEDQYLIADLNHSMQIHHTSLPINSRTRLDGGARASLFLVADGMGGHAAGERASAIVVESVVNDTLNTVRWLARIGEDCEQELERDLHHTIEHCQRRIRAEGDRVPERHGMGTTLTMALQLDEKLYVVHIGDSRCYLLRKGRMQQITRDHTVAQQMLEQGLLKTADGSRWNHVLWNVIGSTESEPKLDLYKGQLEANDIIVLCSDGLTKHLTDAEIARVLTESRSIEERCRILVNQANRAGGTDNITCVVARFDHRSRGTTDRNRARGNHVPAAHDDTPFSSAPFVSMAFENH
jgi:protein phosphatase